MALKHEQRKGSLTEPLFDDDIGFIEILMHNSNVPFTSGISQETFL